MKANFYSSFVLLAVLCFSFSSVRAQESTRRDMRAWEHIAVSLNAGTTGFGLQGATPIHPHFALRAGFSTLPISYSYTYDGIGYEYDHDIEGLPTSVNFEVPLKAKSSMFNGKILVDYFPIADSRFHITAGLYMGNSKIIKVSGYTENDFPIEIGDIWVNPIDGQVKAWIKTNSVKPYVGIGFGRTIPRTRVGFKFELGGLFQGSPKVESPSLADIEEIDVQGEVDNFNKFLNDYFKVYPVMNFQLSYRIF